MEIIRERHNKTKEELKQLLIELIHKNGFGSAIRWNGFAFEGKMRGTIFRGEIFDDELHVEIRGWFEKMAAQQLRQGWRDLVTLGLV
jgi:hypothetical protein